jgi:hypothetical protein
MCWILLGVIMAWAETVYSQSQSTATDAHDEPPHDAPLPEIPPMFKAEPAVLEAGRILRGRSTSRAIPDGRVVR